MNELHKVIDSLVDGIIKEDRENSKEKVKELSLEDIDWTNPAEVNQNFLIKRDEFLPYILEKEYGSITNEQLRRLMFIYKNYDYLDHAIRALVDLGKGFATDKTSWLIEKYKQYVLTNKISEIPEERSYYHPNFGSMKEWMEYCEAAYRYCENMYAEISLNEDDRKRLTEIVDKMQKEHINWKNPDNVNTLYFYEQNNFLIFIIEKSYEEKYNEKFNFTKNIRKMSMISFVYKNYDFLKNILNDINNIVKEKFNINDVIEAYTNLLIFGTIKDSKTNSENISKLCLYCEGAYETYMRGFISHSEVKEKLKEEREKFEQ